MSEDTAGNTESSLSESAAADGKATDQGATSHTLVRTLARATFGFVALGADEILAFVHTSVRRGQEMEASAQKLVGRYQDNANVRAKAAQASRGDLMTQTWVTLDENLRALSRMLTVPDAEELAAEQPSATAKFAVQGEQDNGN